MFLCLFIKELNLRLIAGQSPFPFNRQFNHPVFKPMHDTAKSLDSRIFDVEGKGDCLYHSVFACLYVHEINEDPDGVALKARILEYLQTPEQREKLWYIVLASEQLAYDRWIAALKKRAVWPDSYVIQAVAEVCKVSIYVHSLNPQAPMHAFHCKEEDQGECKGEIHIVNLNNVHFVAMLPKHPAGLSRPMSVASGASGGAVGGASGGAVGGAGPSKGGAGGAVGGKGASPTKGGKGASPKKGGKDALEFSDKHF